MTSRIDYFIIIALMTSSACGYSFTLYVSHQFNSELDNSFIHQTLNNRDGWIYISAVNRLYQLNKNLRTSRTEVMTGPVNDSFSCTPCLAECNAELTLRNNYNKVLLQDPQRDRIIVCGSVYQGICEARSLQNISKVLSEKPNCTSTVDYQESDYVSCMSLNCSTVAVIAEGPTVYNPVLYVGSMFTKTIYRSETKTITTRSLQIDPTRENILFRYAVDSRKKISALPIIESEEDPKDFKYVFETGDIDGFVYFLFQKNFSKSSTSVIARICKKDVYYYSYIEMKITCPGWDVTDNNQLLGAYYEQNLGQDFPVNSTEGVLYVMMRNATGSSLCIFSLEELNNEFDYTTIACLKYNGMDSSGTTIVTENLYKILYCDKHNQKDNKDPWITPDQTLDDRVIREVISPELPYYKDYRIERNSIRCGANYLPTLLKRVDPIVASWSYHEPGFNFSAIASHLVRNEINVVFIGTLNGKLLHINVNSKHVYRVFEVGFPVLSDLLLDDSSTLKVPHLYIMTSNSVYHAKVSACEQYTTCRTCLGAMDPYCGWCILTSSCVPSTFACPSDSWLKPLSQECIEASKPDPVERTLSGDVVTKVNLLPVLQASEMYECVFEGGAPSPAQVDPTDGSTLTCRAPASDKLPQNSEGKDHVIVKLSIRFDSTTDIVSTEAVFYDCGAHGRTLDQSRPCYGCLNNEWTDKCQWCVTTHSCMPRGQGACIVASQSCPRVTSAAVTSQLLSVGIPNEITMNVMNLPDESELQCSIEIEGDVKQIVNAQSSDNNTQVICESHVYSYTMNQTKVPAKVTIFWKSGYVLDAVQENPISFYNCSIKHDDCSLCVAASTEFMCGWCDSQCTIEPMCKAGTWLTDHTQCPAPVIESFSPSSGPLEGDTLVIIKGKNMAVTRGDIGGVMIAGTSCNVVGYLISKEISCRTNGVTESTSGPVIVNVRNVEKTSQDEFEYRIPVLLGLTVPAGLVAGGTTITIIGENLNTGSKIKVYIGSSSSLKCEVILPIESNTALQCVTSRSPAVMMNQTVSVHFDSYTAKLTNAFSYMQNPAIRSTSTASGSLASFIAGGRQIIFVGSRLDLVQKANLITIMDFSSYSNEIMSEVETSKITRKRRKKRRLMERMINAMNGRPRHKRSAVTILRHFFSPCSIQNATHMNCSSATISLTLGDKFTTNVSDTMFLQAELQLELDNLKLPLGGSLKYFPNPVVSNLSEEEQKKEKTGDGYLKIDALNLNSQAVTKEEIEIRVGEKLCPVKSMDENGLLLCTIPEQDQGDPTKLEVTVSIGNKLWSIGAISYFVAPPAITDGVLAGIIAVGVLVFIVVTGVVFYFLRKNKHYKENKNDFQKAIENLEMSVRADFRKAFAELSIDMTDLTADIGDVGLPVLSYRQYATNIFFPSVRFHPCMKEPDPREKPIPAVEQGLVQFSLLIANKQFLISFIRTLEEQKSFSNRDKGNVASLITVVLHKELAYFTEVMKSLISECVAISVQKNPKLVLRRTESVAERIFSNWIAICLFPYIRDKAGKPIFLLHKAIKHQVSKGALDVVTGKARYTLSDDRLLKEDVTADNVTLFVSQSNNSDDEPVIVKVLSCDAITQVKEKVMDSLYKRIPYSQRPKPDQLDLEWRHGRGGHLVLPEIDFASEPGNRWKRVMTLRDYKVENNATMSLITRQQNMYASQDFVSPIMNQTIDSSALSPMLPDDGTKTYHLVKYTDDIEQKRESTIPRDSHKNIPELYLLRLINMKGILLSYVDEVFQVILDTNQIPIAVKYFFDTLDDLAKTHGITDQEILHIWKTNSVLGRFWVTILKTPESVFDIDKPEAVESSMSVISQTFIDACSVQEHKPTKDSPINKQLYAKEIPTYKKMVQKYYKDVENLPPVSDQDMYVHMTEISRSHDVEFDVHAALNELWGYVNKYYEEIQETLTNDSNTTQMVIQRLHQAYTLIDNSVNNP